ncbi:MAG: Fe-S cluster assembly protein SufD [Chlamydiae bacterium]|nr:Fe-S cluster assembly protein SufD [Chlamydiota bacterium]
MAAAIDQPLQPFCQVAEKMFSKGIVDPFRAKAWKRLLQIGWPDKKNEAFTYVPMRQLYSLEYPLAESISIDPDLIDAYILPECKESVIVFVDGSFSQQLSCVSALPLSVAIRSLQEAQKGSYASFLQRRYQQRLEIEEDPFVLLNLAMSHEGAFIFIPPHIELACPIQCLFVYTQRNASSFPKVQIAAGAHSKLSLITTSAYLNGADKGLSSALIDIGLDEGSYFSHTVSTDNPADVWGFYAVRASLKKKSKLDCKNLVTGGKNSRQDYRFTLVGEGADACVTGLGFLEKNQQAHVHVIVDHQAPSCTSNQFFKTVLSDVSRSSFTGKILVRQQAQKTQAYQLNNSLLLTEGTIANSKPGLEILADDVKASHGATVSQLDEDQLFYLKTRGLSQETAKHLLVLGFCNDIVDRIETPSVKNQILLSIKKYLQQQNV